MPTSSLGGTHAPFWSEQLNGFVAKRHEKHMNKKLAQSTAKRRPQSAGPGGRSAAATSGVANMATTVAWGETDPATRSPPKAAAAAPAEKALKKASHGLPLPLGNLAALREAAEALAVENRQLKEHNNSLRALDSVRNTATQKLEQKLRKAHKQVATLLEGRGDHSRAAVADIRKDNEKQLVVSRLREQVETLEALVEERDHALATLQRSLSATAVAEVEAARDEYFHEVQRLQDAKAASEAALSAESADLRQQVHLLTAARRTAAMAGGGVGQGAGGDATVGGGIIMGGGGVGSVGGVPAAAAAAVAEVAALKAHVRGLEADAEQHRLEVKKLKAEGARLASADAARAAELARSAEARAAAKTVASHAHGAASPFTAQRAAEQALQRRKVRRNADRAREGLGGNGGGIDGIGGGGGDGGPANLLAFAGLGDLDDDLDALVLGRPFASGLSSSSHQRAGKTSSSGKSGGTSGSKKKASKKRAAASSSSAAAPGGHLNSIDGHSLASNSSSGPLNSASKLRAAAAAAADEATAAGANSSSSSSSQARKPGVPSQGQQKHKSKVKDPNIASSGASRRSNLDNSGSSPAKKDAKRAAKAQQRDEAARVYEAAKSAALAGVRSNYETEDGGTDDEESRAAASVVKEDQASSSMPQSPLWPIDPMNVGGSTVVLRAGDEDAPEGGGVSEGASSPAESLKQQAVPPPLSRAAAAAESAAAASREAAALAAARSAAPASAAAPAAPVNAPVPKAASLPVAKAPTPVAAAAALPQPAAAANKLVLVGEPLECFFKVVPTVEDPGAVVRQLQGLRLPGCVFDDDYVVVGGDVLGEKGPSGDGLAGAGGENGGSGEGSEELAVLLRCLAWDAENSTPGSGYTRVHRGVNRATLTLPPGALTFGFVDKMEHFTAQDWRGLTGQATSSSVAPPSPTKPQSPESQTPLDRISTTEASSPPFSPPPVPGRGESSSGNSGTAAAAPQFAPFSPKAAGVDTSAMPPLASKATTSSQVDDAEGYGSDDFNDEEGDGDIVADNDSVSDVVGMDIGGSDEDHDHGPTEWPAEELPEEVLQRAAAATDTMNTDKQKGSEEKAKQQEQAAEALNAQAAAPSVASKKASPTNELDELRARSDAAEAAAKADARARAAAEVSRLQRELAAQEELKHQQAIARQQEAAATAAAKAAQARSTVAKATKAAEEEEKEKKAAAAVAAAAAEVQTAAEAKKAQKAAADREAAAQEELARELAEEEEEQRKEAAEAAVRADAAARAASTLEVKTATPAAAAAAPLAEMSIGSPADQSRGVATEASTKYDDEFDDDGDEYGDDFEDEGQ
jgi:hypothetical protein